MVNVFIVYVLHSWPQDWDTDFTLVGCLFEGAKLPENADPDKYVYSGYCIRFNRCIEYS